MIKRSSGVMSWQITDNMRGFTTGGDDRVLYADLPNAEAVGNYCELTSTGFIHKAGIYGTGTFIYIAIRRGPMKTPTSGTSVFSSIAYTGDNTNNRKINTTITPDLSITKARGDTLVPFWVSRLTNRVVDSSATTEERSPTTGYSFGGPLIDTDVQTGIKLAFGTSNGDNSNKSGITFINWNFKRAPGFFDVVCYTGNLSSTARSHSLGVSPELIIIKPRSDLSPIGVTGNWVVFQNTLGANNLYLNTNDSLVAAGISLNANTTTFTTTAWNPINANGYNFVAYLFATLPGVSKVGSYTGTGNQCEIRICYHRFRWDTNCEFSCSDYDSICFHH